MISTATFRAVSPQKMVQQILALKPEQQLQVFTMLHEALTKRGLFGDAIASDDDADKFWMTVKPSIPDESHWLLFVADPRTAYEHNTYVQTYY